MGYKKNFLLIFLIILICVAIYLAYKYSSCINWPGVTGIALILTMIAIICYTIETGRLRRATVRHAELSIRPFVIIDYESGWKLENIGKGHALDIKVEDIAIGENAQMIFNFPRISLIAPNQSGDLVFRIQDRNANDFEIGPFSPYSAQESYNYLIKYTDLNKRQYQTKGTIGEKISVDSTE